MSDKLIEIEKKLSNHEQRLETLEKMLTGSPKKNLKMKSIREFILEKKPRGAVKTALVIGYYLEHFKKISPFSAADVSESFIRAREKVPSNIHDKIYKNLVQGYMMEAQDQEKDVKSYYLTNNGEKFVENNFEK